jgi:secreted trypsin-like serine protease
MLYLFALVFIFFVQDMSAMKDECDLKASCGCSPRPFIKSKIFGGDPALNYTWTISIRNGTNHHFCGGSILNEWYVITAAHCFENSTELAKIIVCAGTNRLFDTCRQPREIQNVINHPSYKKEHFENDIALIQVKVSFNFSDTSIARICLPNNTHPQEYPEPGTNVTAVGWGINKTGHWPDVLQQVTVQVVDESEDNCDDSISYNHSIKLCAAAPEKGKTFLFNRCFSFVSSLFLSSRHL